MNQIEIKQKSELVLAEIKKAVIAFQNAEKDIAPVTNRLTVVEVTEAGLTNAKGQLKIGKQTRKLFADARMEVTRPLDELKKQVMLFESDAAKGLDEQINRVDAEIRDVEAETRRKELAAKAEEERLAKERAEEVQREEQRKRNILNKITQLQQKWSNGIMDAQTQEALDLIEAECTAVNLYDFNESMSDMAEVISGVRKAIVSKRDYLAELSARLKEQERLVKENQKAAAELEAFNIQAEKQKKEAEDATRKLQQERDELAREVEKARIDAENAARQKEAQDAENERKRVEAEIRQKAINAGFDVFVTNIAVVPQTVYEIKWKINEIKEMLRNGQNIPGLRILSKDTDNTSIQ